MSDMRQSDRVYQTCRRAAWIMGLAIVLTSSAVVASDPQRLNDIIGDRSAEKAKKPTQEEDDTKRDPELWVPSSAPLGSVQLIVAQPEANATCQDVIFKRRQPIPVRHEAGAGKHLKISLESACWIGLRNGSDKRSVVLRIGEALQRLSIMPTPQLIVGQTLGPHEQIQIALKPLKIDRLEIDLEAVWIDDVENGSKVQSMTFEFVGNR